MLINAIEDEAGALSLKSFADANGLVVVDWSTVRDEGEVFSVMVSNHCGVLGMDDPRRAPGIVRHGRCQVRMMYSLGKAAWNFAAWNRLYHVILAWGPYHAEQLALVTDSEIVEVGYPRLDGLFNGGIDRQAVSRTYRLDPERKTVLWLPTWRELSSIDAFAAVVSGIRDDVNLLVKLHPLTVECEPDRVALLERLGISPLADTYCDNAELLAVSDLVLCDYGGSPFAALYAGCKVVLLRHPGDAEDELAGIRSMDIAIHQKLPSLLPEQAHRLPGLLAELLADESAFEGFEAARQEILADTIAPYPGRASQRAATQIMRALERSARLRDSAMSRWRRTYTPRPLHQRIQGRVRDWLRIAE